MDLVFDYMRTELSIDDMSTEYLTHCITAAIYFANYIGDYINDQHIGNLLMHRHEFITGNNRLQLATAEPVLLQEVENLKSKLPKNILEKFYDFEDAPTYPYDYIYDLECMSTASLFDNFLPDKNDLTELLLAYAVAEDSKNIDLIQYVKAGFHIKSLLKAYKKAKDLYFANNQDATYSELEKTKKELSDITSLYNFEKQKSEELRKKLINNSSTIDEKIELFESTIKKQQDELEELRKEKKEINALREWIFRQNTNSTETLCDNEEKLRKTYEAALQKLKTIKGLVIGGHPNWKNKLETLLPDWTFLPAEIRPALKLVLNCDVVIFNTSYLSHTVYNSAMNDIRESECKLGYVQTTNIEKAIIEIANQI